MSLKDGSLSKEDTSKIAAHLKRGAPVIPGKDGSLFPIEYLVNIDSRASHEKLSATRALIRLGYLLDVESVPEYLVLLNVVTIPNIVSETIIEGYLNSCSLEPLPSYSGKQRLIEILLCYSYCLRALFATTQLNPTVHSRLQKSLPNLSVICAAWGGPKGFSMQCELKR